MSYVRTHRGYINPRSRGQENLIPSPSPWRQQIKINSGIGRTETEIKKKRKEKIIYKNTTSFSWGFFLYAFLHTTILPFWHTLASVPAQFVALLGGGDPYFFGVCKTTTSLHHHYYLFSFTTIPWQCLCFRSADSGLFPWQRSQRSQDGDGRRRRRRFPFDYLSWAKITQATLLFAEGTP